MNDDRRTDADLADAALALPAGGPCPAGEDLLRFYAGEATEADAERLRDHLATCRACLDAADEARCFVEALRGEGADAEVPASHPGGRPIGRWWPAAAAAALLLVAVTALVPRLAGRGTAVTPRIEMQAPAYVPRATGPGAVFRAGPGDAFAKAMEPYSAGEWEDARRALERHVAAHPADDEARFYLAACRLLLGHDADAWTDFERLAGRVQGPLLEEVRWYRALAALRTGRRATGEAALREIAAGAGPHREDARRLMAMPQAPAVPGR